MKFTLVYDGVLHSQNADNKFDKKWRIRQYLEPQLAELWRIHPGLRSLNRWVPSKGSYMSLEFHHDLPPADQSQPPPNHGTGPMQTEYKDLQVPVNIGGLKFKPLIRDSYALSCGLEILFMKKEPVGRVYQGGDLDNRIKLFIDSLKIPSKSESDQVAALKPWPNEPFHCLLEDDGLISGLSMDTRRLLDAPNTPENYVRLIVDVDVRIAQTRSYNQLFLGD